MVELLILSHKYFNFYGVDDSPDCHFKLDIWREVVGKVLDEPWIFFGDFNLAIEPHEKSGGTCLRFFQRKVKVLWNHSHLIDKGFIRERFTWSNIQEGHARILARLDRLSWKAPALMAFTANS